MTMRKTGRPIPMDQRITWPLQKTIVEIKKLIRTDYGGRDPIKTIIKDAHRNGLTISTDLAKFIHEREKKQVAGCQKRISHNLTALKLRGDKINQKLKKLLSPKIAGFLYI